MSDPEPVPISNTLPFRPIMGLRLIALAGCLLAGLPAWGQEPAGERIDLRVRPPVPERGDERLRRLVESRDFVFRSICTGCTGAANRPAGTPPLGTQRLTAPD